MKQLNSLQKYDILWSSVFSVMKQRLIELHANVYGIFSNFITDEQSFT